MVNDLIGSIKELKMDKFTFSILSVMALMSPDRGHNINLSERRALDNIQESLAALLEIKFQKENRNPNYFTKCLYLLTKLRAFSESF